MKSELKVKDELENMQQQYIDVLKNELELATQIIKNPNLRKETKKRLMFDKRYYYK